MIEPWVYAALTGTAVLTGFIDAIAGGGGLIMMPALLSAGVPPINALATNKLQSMFGTATACSNYARKGLIDFRANLLTVILVFAGASVGVIVVQTIDTKALSLIIPLLLMAVAIYVLVSPRMSDEDAHQRISARGYAPVTKLFNLTSNIASVLLFAIGGEMFWLLGLCMAAGAMLGGWIGSHTAMRFGAQVIRPLLVILSLGLTARLLWSYFAA